MYHHCSVPNCSSKRKDVKFHVFPSVNPLRLSKWLESINSESLRALSNDELGKRFVCHKHFEKRFVTSTSRLLGNGYPTLFTNDEITSGIPSSLHHEDTEKNGVVAGCHDYTRKSRHSDHSYCKEQSTDNNIPRQRLPAITPDGKRSRPKPLAVFPKDKDELIQLPTIIIPVGFWTDIVKKTNIGFLPSEVDPPADDLDTLADDVDDFQEPKQFEEIKLEKENADNLPKLFERLFAKPETQDDADPYLLDILDPDLLTDSIDPENLSKVLSMAPNDNLIAILSEAWPQVLTGGLANEAKQKIFLRYPTPTNCRLLKTPIMNPKIAQLIPKKVLANDDKWFKMQQCVGTAITAISRAMEELLLGKSTQKALRHLTNAGLILCDLHYTHTKIRKVGVTPFADDTVKAVIKDCPTRDDTLFGPDFNKKWKAAKMLEPKKRRVRKKVRAIVKKKKQVTCSEPSLVAYSGQWRAPLLLVRNRRAVGARRPSSRATGPRRPPAPHGQAPKRRRPCQPRPARSPGGAVKRDRTEQLQQIEQYDAFGNKISLTLPNLEESQSFMETQMEARHTQVEPVAEQLNEPRDIKLTKKPVKRKRTGDGSRPLKKRSTKKIQQTEQYDAFGNRITATPTSLHIQTQNEGSSRTRPLLDLPQWSYTRAEDEQVHPTIQNYPDNRVITTRGSIPLLLPPQMSSRDMPGLDSNDEPTDDTQNQVHHGIVDTVTEVDTESGASLLLQFRHA